MTNDDVVHTVLPIATLCVGYVMGKYGVARRRNKAIREFVEVAKMVSMDADPNTFESMLVVSMFIPHLPTATKLLRGMDEYLRTVNLLMHVQLGDAAGQMRMFVCSNERMTKDELTKLVAVGMRPFGANLAFEQVAKPERSNGRGRPRRQRNHQ